MRESIFLRATTDGRTARVSALNEARVNLVPVRGAIAAGHGLTAAAGARVLEAGGNAVDACVAAAFVSWVAESPLTGPGGGGFMLVHSGADCRSRLYDFFVAGPRGRGPAAARP